LKGQQGDYLRTCLALGQHYQSHYSDKHAYALKYFQKAKDTFDKLRGVGDSSIGFDIHMNLARSYFLVGDLKEAYAMY